MTFYAGIKSRAGAILILSGVLVGCALRVIALDSDAYPRLSWSTGLLTDEGFYIHNARNLVLFGQERTNEFNNALIMPVLHFVQVLVFRCSGVGPVQARSISVVASGIALALFYDAMYRAFGKRAALIAVLLLGLDHIYLLYNRLALMDTPATLFLVAAFWAFVRGEVTPHRAPARWYWHGLCGMLLVCAYATRSLSALFLPVPFLALALCSRSSTVEGRGPALLATAVGIIIAGSVYALCWYLPHREEIARMSQHYIMVQLMPRDPGQFARNVYLAIFGDARGMFAYLFRHSPVQFLLSVVSIAAAFPLRLLRQHCTLSDSIISFLRLWLLAGWGGLCWVNYNPSRYYVLFYPAMAGLSALGVEMWQKMLRELLSRRLLACSVTGICAFHAFATFVPRIMIGGPLHPHIVCFGLTLASVPVFVKCMLTRVQQAFDQSWHATGKAVLLGMWAGVNLYWLCDWAFHLSYRQKEISHVLARTLPGDS
ncbi:MAG: glycosyltransferase family 39 protein, partial [Chloroherpetonaceae bacterium]|nr:glycosyltransferase family 39 protein [Chthonomonadaceae bacterium]MDW8208291.1 glycosyltransferase family 39 protein [Chloroherpetonaceae bacterium]